MNGLRIGYGTDIHVLEENRDFVLGGIKIPHEKGFKAHSDGDVLIHAIIDAMLGALALGDIGSHFPDTSDEYKNIDSTVLLEKVNDMISEKGYKIINIDSTVHAEAPKLRPHIDNMRKNLSEILGIDIEQISIKAKTGEGVDAVGQKQAVKAECVVLLNNTFSD